MKNDKPLVVTQDYPENLVNGIMICGLNLGISKKEQQAIANGAVIKKELKSFFSDDAVRKTDRFNRRIVTWLSSWGFEFAREVGKETSFEKSFFQTNWLNSQTKNADIEGKIPNLINSSTGFLALLKERKPSMILFFGKDLLRAFNDTRPIASLEGQSVRDVAVPILGKRSDAQRHDAYRPDGTKTKNHLEFQKFGNTQIISFPHPSSRGGITDEDIKLLKPPVDVLHNLSSKQVKG